MTDFAPPQFAPQNWKLVLAYDGTDYRGWQVQPGLPTIQGELQGALGRVVGEAPLPQGSGRTDAGVHALAQVASFSLQARIPAESLQRALNRALPAAIRVTAAEVVSADFHARHSTVAKTYEYRVFQERDGDVSGARRICPPFLARFVYTYSWPLDMAKLQESARLFLGQHDFTSFAATSLDEDDAAEAGKGDEAADAPVDDALAWRRTAVRTIFASEWERRDAEDGAVLVYRVRGNGFLHHMVRNLVGTMLDVGRGYTDAAEIPGMIEAKARAAAGPTAPARGLFLHSVEYASDLRSV